MRALSVAKRQSVVTWARSSRSDDVRRSQRRRRHHCGLEEIPAGQSLCSTGAVARLSDGRLRGKRRSFRVLWLWLLATFGLSRHLEYLSKPRAGTDLRGRHVGRRKEPATICSSCASRLYQNSEDLATAPPATQRTLTVEPPRTSHDLHFFAAGVANAQGGHCNAQGGFG